MSTETETQTQPTWATGDQITISRGNKRGQTGKVVDVDATKQEYAVRLDQGGLQVVSFASVKAPVEKTYTETEVRALLTGNGLDADAVLNNQTPALD
jgi:hypothetical protein